MRARYAWQCFACSAANVATADVCTVCGFLARATGADIAAAKAANAQGARPTPLEGGKPTIEAISDALAPLPFWRQCLAVCGGLMSVGGMLWLKITFSFVGFAWSVVAVIVGLAAMGLAFVGYEAHSSSARQSKTTSLAAAEEQKGNADG